MTCHTVASTLHEGYSRTHTADPTPTTTWSHRSMHSQARPWRAPTQRPVHNNHHKGVCTFTTHIGKTQHTIPKPIPRQTNRHRKSRRNRVKSHKNNGKGKNTPLPIDHYHLYFSLRHHTAHTTRRLHALTHKSPPTRTLPPPTPLRMEGPVQGDGPALPKGGPGRMRERRGERPLPQIPPSSTSSASSTSATHVRLPQATLPSTLGGILTRASPSTVRATRK